MSIADYYTRWHKFGGHQATNNALVYMWGRKILRLLANTALYLANGTRYAYSYYGGLIGSHRQSIEWWHCRWSWVTPNSQNYIFLLHLAPVASLVWVKLDTSNLVHLLIMVNCSQTMTSFTQMGRGQGHVAPSYFGKTVAISRKRCKIATWLNERLLGNHMIVLPVTLVLGLGTRPLSRQI